jgi:hypothetical protein
MVIIDKIIQKQQIKELAQIIKKNANNDKLNLIYDLSYSLEFDKMLEFVNNYANRDMHETGASKKFLIIGGMHQIIKTCCQVLE